MAYIVVVNPLIMQVAGLQSGAVMVATIVAASLSTLVMGLYANYPFALAPGMGLNAFFAYTLVVEQGIPWEIALGSCFWSGLLFLLLNLLGVRQLILEAIPETLRISLTAGIGMFLAFIALSNLQVVVAHPETLVTLGDLRSKQIALAGFGLVLSSILLYFHVRGAILLSALATWLLGVITGAAVWQGLIAPPPSISPTLFKMDLWGALSPKYLGALFTLTLIAIFDAAGTVASLAEQGKFIVNKRLPRIRRIFLADAVGTMVGAMVGSSPMTTYLESGAGVAAGGRTGVVALTVSLLFLLSLFFSPLITSIPFFATAPALIIVGAQMIAPIAQLNFEDITEYIPSFIVLITIPLTFSISTGIAVGILFFPLLKIFTGKYREVHWLLWILALLFLAKFAL